MSSISISAPLAGAFSGSAHRRQITNGQKLQATRKQSASTKHHVVVALNDDEKQESSIFKSDQTKLVAESVTELSAPKFSDGRWKNGTWDLNMFVNDGMMDWDGVIVAEAKRRRFLEMFPEACTEQEPVLFRSSIVPWWAWFRRSYLPQAELLNGQITSLTFILWFYLYNLVE